MISSSDEKVDHESKQKLAIFKDGGTLVLESNAPLIVKASEKGRIFNQVPGMEVLPILIPFPEGVKELTCDIYIQA